MEKIETLNQRLVDYYGLDSDTGRPIFRIVFADDQTEKRMVTETHSGFRLLFPTLAEVKKYPYLKGLYVLERLVIVPDINQHEIPTSKLSYEPVWAYRDSNNEPIPPVWPATQFIVDSLYEALGKTSKVKYKQSEKDTTLEGQNQKINELQQELFGNETEVGDALRYKEAVVVPSNYKKES